MKPLFSRLDYSPAPAVNLNAMQTQALARFRKKTRDGEYDFEEVTSLCGAEPGGRDALLVAQRDRYGLRVRTWISLRSGVIWQSPRMTQASLARFYREDAPIIYKGAVPSRCEYYAKQILRGATNCRWIVDHLPQYPWHQRKVFDVGCGAGGKLECFREKGCLVYGCDPGAQDYVEFGRQRGLLIEHGGYEELDKYGKADLIILSHVLEHVREPIQMLRGLASRLSPTGMLFVEVPGVTNLGTYGHDLLRCLQNAHLYYFSRQVLKATAATAGLQPIAADDRIHMLLRRSQSAPVVEWDPSEARRILHYLKREERHVRYVKPLVGAVRSVMQLAHRIAIRGYISSCLGGRDD